MACYICLKACIREYFNDTLCGQLTVYVYNDVKHYQLGLLSVCVCVCIFDNDANAYCTYCNEYICTCIIQSIDSMYRDGADTPISLNIQMAHYSLAQQL